MATMALPPPGNLPVGLPPPVEGPPPASRHFDNLVDTLDPMELETLASDLARGLDEAQADNREADAIMAKGLAALGVDRRGSKRQGPFEGSSEVVHPAMAKSLLNFQANAVAELCPATGPARTLTTGKPDPTADDLADRQGRALNDIIARKMPEWRSEMDRMLMMLGIEGSSFKKIWWDAKQNRPRAAYIPGDQVWFPYNASSDLSAAPIIWHIMYLTEAQALDNIESGLWKAHVPTENHSYQKSKTAEASDRAAGQQQTSTLRAAQSFIYAECSITHAFGESIGREWIITIELSTNIVVAVRRNWREGDVSGRRLTRIIHYPMFPWRGARALGLFHFAGSLSEASTGTLRALLDGAALHNAPGGFYLGGRDGKAIPFKIGQWTAVEARAGIRDIRDLMMGLPYGGPSPVMYELLGFLTQQSEEFASTSLQQVADGKQDLPVGSMLLMLEQGVKVYSAIHKRLVNAEALELLAIKELIVDHADDEMLAEWFGGRQEVTIADLRDASIIPVADPNSPSQAHRLAVAQAQLDLMAKAKEAGEQVNMRAAILAVGRAMNMRDLDLCLPETPTVTADPFSENTGVLNGANLAVGDADDHAVHIAVHMMLVELPQVSGGPAGMKLVAHILDHAARFAMMAGEAGMGEYQKVVKALAGLIQPGDPAMVLAQAEMLKAKNGQRSADDRLRIEEAKLDSEEQKVATKLEADLTLAREENQLAMEENAAKLAAELRVKQEEMNLRIGELEAKVQLAREGNASRERQVAAQVATQAELANVQAEAAKEAAKNKPAAGKSPKK